MSWQDIEEAAGVLGIDPGPLTARELFWRYHGRLRVEWLQTGTICSVVANTVPRKSKRTIRPGAFSPYRINENEKVTFKELLGLMKGD